MLSKRRRHPGRLNSMAVVIPATPPPRITTRGSASPNGSLPEDVTQIDDEVEVHPERHPRPTRCGNAELARDRLAVERLDAHVVVAQHPAAAELLDDHVDSDDGLIA